MDYLIDFVDVLTLISPEKILGSQNFSKLKLVNLNLNNDDPNCIMWCSDKNIPLLSSLNCGVVICSKKILTNQLNHSCTFLIVNSPRLAFVKLLDFFQKETISGISHTAKIHKTVNVGRNVYIGENVVIEAFCTIGNNTRIDHNTIIKSYTKIEDNVIIGSNNSIGSDGFGYVENESKNYKLMPHLGNVVIEKNVEIGNNNCIDKAVLGSTIIGENTKIDNLVHIAHGVVIGKNCLIIANSEISGSVVIKNNCWIAPSSSILNGITIEENVVIGLGAVVIRDVEGNSTVVGNPAKKI